MLWLALHFPLLPLEALPLRRSPSAVVARGRVVVRDAAAGAAGVVPGQKLSTALGLAPGLSALERDPAREARALFDLACWCGRFTPTISLRSPALLLEIGGCLRLFGGLGNIVEAVREGCAAQGWTLAHAVALTPLGALWLARTGSAPVCEDLPALHAALAQLSCELPGWPTVVGERLQSYGLARLGELRALPLPSLRQRLGNEPVDELLRAWGEVPDPQLPFVFPERFESRLELPSRVEHAEALAFGGQRLFAALAGWLEARQLLLRVCTLTLTHDDAPETRLPLAFAEPAADEARFVRLLRERLSRLELADPVEALALSADEVVPRSNSSLGLFATPTAGEGAAACLDRLRARLGEAAVQWLAVRPDHRPECATRALAEAAGKDFGQKFPSTAAAVSSHATASRPLWLMPSPQPLAERGGQPHWHGPLTLLTRPERLESGWWDEGETGATGDVRRDYFVARNPQGQWAWIFRDAGGWYLHGLFA